MQMHALRHINICLSLTHGLMHTHIQNTMLLVSSPLQEMMMAFQEVCGTQGAKKQSSGMKNDGRGEEEEREMVLLGGFHGVRTRRGASTEVCFSQHGAGDDSYPSRHDECQGSLFSFPFLSLTHTAHITQTS